MQREYQIAIKSQNVIGNLPPAVEPAAATTVRSLRNEKSSLKSITLDDSSEGEQVPTNPPPLLRRLDRITSSGDVLPKSANSGFPKLTRNLLLTSDKKSYSSGVIESANKQRSSPGLLPQEVTTAARSSSLSRQTDGVRLPPVVSVGNTSHASHDLMTRVKSLPGMYARGTNNVSSAKNIPEIVNTKPPPSVSRLPDGSKSMIRTPPSMFGSSPVVIGRAPQPQVVSNSPQYGTSPTQHSTTHGKPITLNRHLQRELSAVKSDTSLSYFDDANSFEQRKLEAKSPGSVYDSSEPLHVCILVIIIDLAGASDVDSTMTTMLMPQLLSLQKHGSTNDAGEDTLELYSSSSASDVEMFGHQKRMPKEKKM